MDRIRLPLVRSARSISRASLRHRAGPLIRVITSSGGPQVAIKFVKAAQELVLRLLHNPNCGHSARFESSDLTDILRVSVPGFSIFAVSIGRHSLRLVKIG